MNTYVNFQYQSFEYNPGSGGQGPSIPQANNTDFTYLHTNAQSFHASNNFQDFTQSTNANVFPLNDTVYNANTYNVANVTHINEGYTAGIPQFQVDNYTQSISASASSSNDTIISNSVNQDIQPMAFQAQPQIIPPAPPLLGQTNQTNLASTSILYPTRIYPSSTAYENQLPSSSFISMRVPIVSEPSSQIGAAMGTIDFSVRNKAVNKKRPNIDSAQLVATTSSPTSPILPTYSSSSVIPTVAATKSSKAVHIDPYASQFLLFKLGHTKYNIFMNRLYERRFVNTPGELLDPAEQILARRRRRETSKNQSAKDTYNNNTGETGVYDFLVKVEVVKEVMREYVPHPHNPLKSLSHKFTSAPAGEVTLTRQMLLLLCGWSNTQYSYWVRRSEAIAVLSEYDKTLGRIKIELLRRLMEIDEVWKSVVIEEDDVEGVGEDMKFTGKGLDSLIETVKNNTGISPFIRGKHASLDRFGFPVGVDTYSTSVSGCSSEPTNKDDTDPAWINNVLPKKKRKLSNNDNIVEGKKNTYHPIAQNYFMPSFQMESYKHSLPPNSTVETGHGGELESADLCNTEHQTGKVMYSSTQDAFRHVQFDKEKSSETLSNACGSQISSEIQTAQSAINIPRVDYPFIGVNEYDVPIGNIYDAKNYNVSSANVEESSYTGYSDYRRSISLHKRTRSDDQSNSGYVNTNGAREMFPVSDSRSEVR